jgi:hypothetical protein
MAIVCPMTRCASFVLSSCSKGEMHQGSAARVAIAGVIAAIASVAGLFRLRAPQARSRSRPLRTKRASGIMWPSGTKRSKHHSSRPGENQRSPSSTLSAPASSWRGTGSSTSKAAPGISRPARRDLDLSHAHAARVACQESQLNRSSECCRHGHRKMADGRHRRCAADQSSEMTTEAQRNSV